MDYLLLFALLILYPLLMLNNFYQNKRWVFFGLLSIFVVIGLYSVLWAFYWKIASHMCASVYILPFCVCLYVNIICGVIHLIAYLFKKFVKWRGLSSSILRGSTNDRRNE